MSLAPDNDTEARLAALEEQVRELTRRVDATKGGSVKKAQGEGNRASAVVATRARKAVSGGAWIGRIGIGFFLVGIGLLFKFGMDQGWIGDDVRVVFGLILSLVLVGLGLRTVARHRPLAHTLIGGGIATLFVTVYAAFVLYEIFNFPVALAIMTLGTASCYVISVRLRGAVLALVATMGGLGTPFILETDSGTALGLSLYIGLVVACAAGVYMYGGWRSLIWTAGLGGFIAMQVGHVNLTLPEMNADLADRAWLQGGFIFCFLAAGVLPVCRHYWRVKNPGRWPEPSLRARWLFLQRPDLMLAVVSAWAIVSATWTIWDWQDSVWLVVGTLICVGYAIVGGVLGRQGLSHASNAHGVAAAIAILLVSSHLANSLWAWLLTAAMVMSALHYASRINGSKAMSMIGFLLGAIVGVLLGTRLSGADGSVEGVFDWKGLADLAVVGLMAACTWAARLRWQRVTYRMLAFIGLHWWLYRAFAGQEQNGQAYVTIAWVVSALVFFVVGWMRRSDTLRVLGLIVLSTVVAKLLFVDIGQLGAVWRILLFMGFGGILLILSYLFPSLWNVENQTMEDPPSVAAGPDRPGDNSNGSR